MIAPSVALCTSLLLYGNRVPILCRTRLSGRAKPDSGVASMAEELDSLLHYKRSNVAPVRPRVPG